MGSQAVCPASPLWSSEWSLPPCLGLGARSLTVRSSSFSKANRTLVNYDPMDEIQIAEINSQVRRYLEGTLEEIDVSSPSGPPCPAGPGLSPGHTMMYAALA